MDRGQFALHKMQNQNVSFVVPMLPLTAQRSFLEFVRDETSKLNNLMRKTSGAITPLTRYHTALITATTTGKINVRNWQVTETTT